MVTKKDYPVKIGPREFLLRFNFDAMTTTEDLLGKSFFEAVIRATAAEISALRALFFAGLRKNHPEITLEKVNEILDDMEDFQSLAEAILTPCGELVAQWKKSGGVKKKPGLAGRSSAKTDS